MVPELGTYSLCLALAVALVQGTLPLAGLATGRRHWIGLAAPAALVQGLLASLAMAALLYCFVTLDFSVRYVVQHANSLLPLGYRLSGAWGGHEGSLLLWVWMLTAWGAALALASGRLEHALRARALAVQGLVSAGFLLFALLTSNPFARLHTAAADGMDLNPLLQDIGMIIHPPMLYMGYVGLSVPFSLAIAALLGGQAGSGWARQARPWALAAWSFLTLGIMLGSAWAYYELGWGGWWFWDPVENASLMPWLAATALLHVLATSDKRATLTGWALALAILAFALSLLGAFLVRSGVLTSVHAFASDPRRGLFILGLLAVAVGAALLLLVWRGPRADAAPRPALLSRAMLILLNSVLLVSATATVLLGTLYPLALDTLGLGKLSVGAPYFETVLLPLMLAMLVLMAPAPLLSWTQAQAGPLLRQLGMPLLLAVVLAGVAVSVTRASWATGIGLAAALWVILAGLAHLLGLGRGRRGKSGRRLPSGSAGWWGMWLAHLGVAVFAIGVALAKGLGASADAAMARNDTLQVGGHQFRLTGTELVPGPNYVATRATIVVQRPGAAAVTLHPERRYYPVQNQTMTEAAIRRQPWRDLYVSLGDSDDGQRWIVRAQVKPFMSWVWGGCVLMAAGGLLAAADRRYRRLPAHAAGPAGTAGATPDTAPPQAPGSTFLAPTPAGLSGAAAQASEVAG